MQVDGRGMQHDMMFFHDMFSGNSNSIKKKDVIASFDLCLQFLIHMHFCSVSTEGETVLHIYNDVSTERQFSHITKTIFSATQYNENN